jgi:hypothetical protein
VRVCVVQCDLPIKGKRMRKPSALLACRPLATHSVVCVHVQCACNAATTLCARVANPRSGMRPSHRFIMPRLRAWLTLRFGWLTVYSNPATRKHIHDITHVFAVVRRPLPSNKNVPRVRCLVHSAFPRVSHRLISTLHSFACLMCVLLMPSQNMFQQNSIYSRVRFLVPRSRLGRF